VHVAPGTLRLSKYARIHVNSLRVIGQPLDAKIGADGLPFQWLAVGEGPVLYLGFGGLLGGWQEPRGLFFVIIFGVASVCPEVKVSGANAVSISPSWSARTAR
jgi:hypothetical protein